MRRFVAVLLGLALVAAADGQRGAMQRGAGQREPKGPHARREAKAEIEGLESQWRTAQLSDDAPAMEKLLAEDYLGVTSNGSVLTKAQQLDRMRDRHILLKKLQLSDTKVKLSGTIAVVTSMAELDGVAEGEPLRGLFRYTQVYQRTAGIWRITSFEATKIRAGQHSGG